MNDQNVMKIIDIGVYYVLNLRFYGNYTTGTITYVLREVN